MAGGNCLPWVRIPPFPPIPRSSKVVAIVPLPIAQAEEHGSYKAEVIGASPIWRTNIAVSGAEGRGMMSQKMGLSG